MGRKPKCTVEEKVVAVEDYLNGTRSVSEIMTDLSIKSTRTINWMCKRPQDRFCCKTPAEVRQDALSAKEPVQYPIAENKRIAAYKSKWCA